MRTWRLLSTVCGSRGWHHRCFPSFCAVSSLELLDTEVGLVTLAAGTVKEFRKRCHRMDFISAHGCSRQCILRSYSFVGPVGQRWIHDLPFVPSGWGYYRWLAKHTLAGSLEQGTPSSLMMTITLFIFLISFFYTDIIGVHPIFSFLLPLFAITTYLWNIGGFFAGLVIPHDNGYTIFFVKNLRTWLTIVFLPTKSFDALRKVPEMSKTILNSSCAAR
jgi:hypothetical protein